MKISQKRDCFRAPAAIWQSLKNAHAMERQPEEMIERQIERMGDYPQLQKSPRSARETIPFVISRHRARRALGVGKHFLMARAGTADVGVVRLSLVKGSGAYSTSSMNATLFPVPTLGQVSLVLKKLAWGEGETITECHVVLGRGELPNVGVALDLTRMCRRR